MTKGMCMYASSNACKFRKGNYRRLRTLVSRKGRCSMYITVKPVVVVGFIAVLAGGLRVPAIMSVGPVVMSKANVYKTYHLVINKRMGFTYISKPRFSKRLISFSRTVGHRRRCGARRNETGLTCRRNTARRNKYNRYKNSGW